MVAGAYYFFPRFESDFVVLLDKQDKLSFELRFARSFGL